jgi:hypothetical protein
MKMFWLWLCWKHVSCSLATSWIHLTYFILYNQYRQCLGPVSVWVLRAPDSKQLVKKSMTPKMMPSSSLPGTLYGTANQQTVESTKHKGRGRREGREILLWFLKNNEPELNQSLMLANSAEVFCTS